MAPAIFLLITMVTPGLGAADTGPDGEPAPNEPKKTELGIVPLAGGDTDYGIGAGFLGNVAGLDPAGRFLYAANENGDTVVTFKVDTSSGKLTPTGQVIKNSSPVTIVFTGRP